MKDEENATPQHLPIDMADRIQVKGSHVKLLVRTQNVIDLEGSLERQGHPRIYYLDSVMRNHPNLFHSQSDQVLLRELTCPGPCKTNSMCNPLKAYYLDNHGNLTNGYLLGTENTFIFK